MIGLALLDSLHTGDLNVLNMSLNLLVSFVGAILLGSGLGLVWAVLHQRFLQGIDNMMFTSFALAFILYVDDLQPCLALYYLD